MKKVLITLLLGILIQVMAEAKNNLLPLPNDRIKVTITVEIGQPITCILAFSVCKIDVGVGFLAGQIESFETDGHGGSGLGSGGGGGGSWVLSLPKDKFAKYYPDYLSRLDGKSTVMFEYPYVLPSSVKKALGTTRDLEIKANVPYPVKNVNGNFEITFPY